MTFGEKLKAARIESGLKQTELAKKLNTTGNTISNWENNVSKPDLDTLSYICGILHVKASYFLHATLPEDEVSIPELNMIKSYRALDQHGKETVSYMLERETDRVKQIEQAASTPAATRMINYYYKLASAGTGQIVFDMPPTKRIEIPAIPEYRKADYAIGVNGNSMEPVYHDGDTLLVEMTDHVDVGEIGIFLVNGESFVKKREKTELRSLNPESANVPLSESARCLGRVIGKL